MKLIIHIIGKSIFEIALTVKKNLLKQGFDNALPREDFNEFEKENIDNG